MVRAANHKERTRARILEEAAKAIRERGFEGIGIASLMNRAGLTHGGFYAHFKDRDDLVAAALDRMFEDSKAIVERSTVVGNPRASLAALIDYYLSEVHRLKIANGCPVAALSSEAARMPAEARMRFEDGAARFRGAISKWLAEMGVEDPDDLASSVAAELVGALTLARATSGKSDAAKLLARSRDQLKERLGIS